MTVTIGDPMTLLADAYQTIDGIRADTSSRGVDLAGALVVATYADGTTENLTWAALDPYTFGGATGVDIDMSFGFSAHILTTTKLLASLEIDLRPASSVFDITTTMEDDPDGINTPTSKNGFPFELLTVDADETGNVGVTYSDIVNLAGHPAEGDLFTTILIDFSGLAAGGLLGEVTWNSDIDTLETAGDLAPTPPSYPPVTVIDTQDAFQWLSYTDTFDANGVIVLRELVYDDGREIDTTYTDGVRSSSLQTDVLDVTSWDTQLVTFDAAGVRTNLIKTFDNGRVLGEQFQDGIKTLGTTTDVLDLNAWQSVIETFDAAGDRVLRQTLYDSGRQVDIAFMDGVKTTQLSTDVADDFNWASQAVTFDASGERTRQTNTYDTGLEVDLTFVNGIKTTQLSTDVVDDFNWASQAVTFDATGQRTQQTNTYDNGRQLEFDYVDGLKTQVTATDVEGVFAWQTYVDTFDTEGTRVTRTITFDDGEERFISYVDDLIVG